VSGEILKFLVLNMWQNIYYLDNLLNLAGDFVDIKQGTQILDKVVARNSFDEFRHSFFIFFIS